MRRPIDLYETYDGDLVVENGDIKDTQDNYARAANQIIKTILGTSPGDNVIFPNACFNSDKYEGSPNTKEVAEEIKKEIRFIIDRYTVFFPQEIEVDAYPIDRYSIVFTIKINSVDAPETYFLAYDTNINKVGSFIKQSGSNSIETIYRALPPTKNSRA